MKTLALFLLLCGFAGVNAASAASVAFKFATVAPEGSMWMVVMHEVADEIKAKTKGNVEIKLYPGGIAGDEPDVLRKMRVGQYHGAGFTGVGLGEVAPEIRILELPFFYLLSKKPIRGVDDMNGVKMWAWEGDPLADAMLKMFKISPVRVALQDVLMGLQTGMINAAYAPPLAALALQWQTKVKYMTSEPMTNSVGAILFSKTQWEKLTPADQQLVRKIMANGAAKLAQSTAKQNSEVIEKFKQQGIQIVTPAKEGRDEMFNAGAKVRQELVGKLYSADLLKRVEDLVQEFRTKKPAKKK